MKEDNKGLKQEGFTPNGRFDDCKENKTIEHRAKEYLKKNEIMSKWYEEGLPMSKILSDFHKQELSNALPSNEQIDKQLFIGKESLNNGFRNQGAKWFKQQILNNIK